VNTTDRDTRVRLRVAAEGARTARARTLEQLSVDHVALRTDEPYAQALHHAFARRARRMRR